MIFIFFWQSSTYTINKAALIYSWVIRPVNIRHIKKALRVCQDVLNFKPSNIPHPYQWQWQCICQLCYETIYWFATRWLVMLMMLMIISFWLLLNFFCFHFSSIKSKQQKRKCLFYHITLWYMLICLLWHA